MNYYTEKLEKNKKRGFTLVELIVVLVILAILAAIAIPTFSRYLNSAQNTSASMECRNCVLSAQVLYTDHFSEGDEIAWVGADQAETRRTEILSQASASGTITEDTYDDSKVTKLVYTTSNGVTVTYENGTYSINGQEVNPGGGTGNTPQQNTLTYNNETGEISGIADALMVAEQMLQTVKVNSEGTASLKAEEANALLKNVLGSNFPEYSYTRDSAPNRPKVYKKDNQTSVAFGVVVKDNSGNDKAYNFYLFDDGTTQKMYQTVGTTSIKTNDLIDYWTDPDKVTSDMTEIQ